MIRIPRSPAIVLATIVCLLLATSLSAQQASVLRDGGAPYGLRLAGDPDPQSRKVYIVQLATPPATAVSLAGAVSKSRAPGARPRIDMKSSAVQSYVSRLGQEQDKLLARAAPAADKIYSYRYSLNGFAARLTAAEANKLANLPEVLEVWEDEIRPLATNFSAEFLGLFDNDGGLRGAAGLDGEGIVIGFIDSGVYPEHPALTDTREADRPGLCQSSWAEATLLGRWLCGRFDRLEDELVFDPPENWSGTCQSGEQFEPTACNNKLIGARWFIDGAEATGPIDTGEIRSARDVDGHGTHTATTAAGNRVVASIFGTRIGAVEGIAPRARVAVYKACWLRPGNQRASCNTSDLANAIDTAVADGVDIINYSVGSSLIKITAPDDIALLEAAKAGVLSVVAAGNDGPGFGSLGSPAGGPWVITTAASTRDGETSVEALRIDAPPSIAGKIAVEEASFTPPLRDRDPLEGPLILADDDDRSLDDGSDGTTADACQPLVNTDEMDGNIALIQRGGCDFDVKVANAETAGAIAAVVYNLSGGPTVMNGTTGLSDIPALMIGQADGNLILAELDAGNEVTVTLDKGLLLTEAETGNVMATFSARGPAPVPGILKPDVSSPGVNILAGFAPDAANAPPDETYAYLSGTSMATPHVAGVAALLLQAHPEWSPAAVKSALMTTARQDLTLADGETTANPFDFGAGHIVPNGANDPGIVYDAGADDYDAFACGIESPAVSAERCTELSGAGASFDPAELNQPAITVARLANERTVSRRVTNVADASLALSASVTPPPGLSVTVFPETLALGPGQSADYSVTMRYLSGPLDLWRFGELRWTGDEHVARSPLVVRPVSLTAPDEIVGVGGTGSITFPVEFGYTGAYSPGVHGLNLPLVLDGFVDDDPSKTFTFRDRDGVAIHLIDVPAAQLYIRFALFDALTDGDDDLDMYVYFCPDNINCFEIGKSGENTSQERFDVFRPDAGRYAVLIHGFATDNVAGGPGANYSLLGWGFGIVDDPGNLTAGGPATVAAGTTEDVTVNWANLASDTIYLGGISHNSPDGLVGLTLVTIGN